MGIQSFADPLGHQLISVLHFAPTKDLIQSKAAHGLLWCMARSLWPQLKRYGGTRKNQIIRCLNKYLQFLLKPSSLFAWPIGPAKYFQLIWKPSSLFNWPIGPVKYLQLICKPSSLFTWPIGPTKYLQLIWKSPSHYVYIPLAVGELNWALFQLVVVVS